MPFFQVHFYRYNKLFLSFDDLNVRWLMVNNYICNKIFVKHVWKKNFKFSSKINLDEVRLTYVHLSATSERSTTLVSSEV